eukprot:TRINITY_DN393_c4_g1_i4.p1 TRINITY_DN393_c4_g1~~TRINITY_DN393_c4_g1_i4.p1  ORF type:complete len:899 (+),score=177.06 TRINITY_DN393_c4_g1_i4:5560-8256(+)
MPTYRYICSGCNKDDFVSAQSIAGHAAACPKYQHLKNKNPNKPPKNKKVTVTRYWWATHQKRMTSQGLNAYHPSSKASRSTSTKNPSEKPETETNSVSPSVPIVTQPITSNPTKVTPSVLLIPKPNKVPADEETLDVETLDDEIGVDGFELFQPVRTKRKATLNVNYSEPEEPTTTTTNTTVNSLNVMPHKKRKLYHNNSTTTNTNTNNNNNSIQKTLLSKSISNRRILKLSSSITRKPIKLSTKPKDLKLLKADEWKRTYYEVLQSYGLSKLPKNIRHILTQRDVLFDLAERIIKDLRINNRSVFVETSSGLGTLSIQIAARTGCSCYGFEMHEDIFRHAQQITIQLSEVMSKKGQTLGNIKYFKGQFSDALFDDIIKKSTVFFVNNISYDTSVERVILEKLSNLLRDGTNVVTLKEFNKDILDSKFGFPKKHAVTFWEDFTSWSNVPLCYYVYSVNQVQDKPIERNLRFSTEISKTIDKSLRSNFHKIIMYDNTCSRKKKIVVDQKMSDIRKFPCKKCYKVFSTQSSLTSHSRLCNPDIKKETIQDKSTESKMMIKSSPTIHKGVKRPFSSISNSVKEKSVLNSSGMTVVNKKRDPHKKRTESESISVDCDDSCADSLIKLTHYNSFEESLDEITVDDVPIIAKSENSSQNVKETDIISLLVSMKSKPVSTKVQSKDETSISKETSSWLFDFLANECKKELFSEKTREIQKVPARLKADKSKSPPKSTSPVNTTVTGSPAVSLPTLSITPTITSTNIAINNTITTKPISINETKFNSPIIKESPSIPILNPVLSGTVSLSCSSPSSSLLSSPNLHVSSPLISTITEITSNNTTPAKIVSNTTPSKLVFNIRKPLFNSPKTNNQYEFVQTVMINNNSNNVTSISPSSVPLPASTSTT